MVITNYSVAWTCSYAHTVRYQCTVWTETHTKTYAFMDTIVCIWERNNNTQRVTEWVHNVIVCVCVLFTNEWNPFRGNNAILFNICRRLNSHKCRILNEWRENIFDVRPWNCVMAVYFPCRRMYTHSTHVRVYISLEYHSKADAQCFLRFIAAFFAFLFY